MPLNVTSTELEQLVWQVSHELHESKQQVTYLKRVVTTKKVAALKVAFYLQKSSETVTVTLETSLDNVQSRLTAADGQRLAKLCIEKNAVASLSTKLALAYVSCIPLPVTLDDLAAGIEQIMTCTSKPGSHLTTKVQVICEV
jgi:hypothetical protein